MTLPRCQDANNHDIAKMLSEGNHDIAKMLSESNHDIAKISSEGEESCSFLYKCRSFRDQAFPSSWYLGIFPTITLRGSLESLNPNSNLILNLSKWLHTRPGHS
jgi:hypothetical protein